MLILWGVFFLTWSMWGIHLSRVSRVTPDDDLCQTIDCFPEECYWSGLGEVPSGTRDHRGAPRDINGFSICLTTVEDRWGTTPGSWRRLAGSYYGRRPRRGLTRRGERLRACCWHKLKRIVEINPPWASLARMPQRCDVAVWKDAWKADPWGTMRFYGLCKRGRLWVLACRGGRRSRRYRRLWPRRGTLRLLAFFRQSSWLFFQQCEPAERTCYSWVYTQNARPASVRARLFHVRS